MKCVITRVSDDDGQPHPKAVLCKCGRNWLYEISSLDDLLVLAEESRSLIVDPRCGYSAGMATGSSGAIIFGGRHHALQVFTGDSLEIRIFDDYL